MSAIPRRPLGRRQVIDTTPTIDIQSLRRSQVESSGSSGSSGLEGLTRASQHAAPERTPLTKRFPAATRALLTKDRIAQAMTQFEGPVRAALQRVQRMPAIAALTPASLKGDPPISGRIDRSIKRGKQRVLFRPHDKEIQPFPLELEDTWGLRHGAEVEIETTTTPSGETKQRIVTDREDFGRAFVGEVAKVDGRWVARGIGANRAYETVPLDDAAAARAPRLEGQAIVCHVQHRGQPDRVGHVLEVLGPSDGARARFLSVATDNGLSLTHPEEAMAEVRAFQQEEITGKSFEELPFVTIDGKDTVDLDQAVCVQERPGGGVVVHYAIADAAHYVKEGSALDKEAVKRSLSAYLPGRSIPMLPRELSEDLCSLVANKRRRAFVVTMELDDQGKLLDSKFERGVIKARAKLDFEGVQEFMDTKAGPLANQDYSRSLELLQSIGGTLIDRAKDRKVVDSQASESRGVPSDATPCGFELKSRDRLMVERFNEQISLMTNHAVAARLEAEDVKALHRAHAKPDPDKVAAFRRSVAVLGRPWPKDQAMSDYLAALDSTDPKTACIRRMATRTNVRASYTPDSPGHHGLKLKHYLHFTAPMRRYPDIVAARVLAAIVEGTPIPHQDDDDLDFIARCNERAARMHGTIASQCTSILGSMLLEPHVGEAMSGTVVDVSPGGFKVELDAFPAEISVSSGLMQKTEGGQYGLVNEATAYETPKGLFGLGDRADLRILGVDTLEGEVDAIPAAFGDGPDARAA
ncbi:MAG: RNB domain-containing ribonuclease [Deltaproteobacteria bacterium]